MNRPEADAGVFAAVVQRLTRQRLPRALAMERRLAAGERLGEFDIAFLERALFDVRQVQWLVDRHPEYRPLVARVIHLYDGLAGAAVENERRALGVGSDP